MEKPQGMKSIEIDKKTQKNIEKHQFLLKYIDFHRFLSLIVMEKPQGMKSIDFYRNR